MRGGVDGFSLFTSCQNFVTHSQKRLRKIESFGGSFEGSRVSTVRLTSTGNSVSENRDFPFSHMETIVGQVEKIGSLTWGMVWRSILAEI